MLSKRKKRRMQALLREARKTATSAGFAAEKELSELKSSAKKCELSAQPEGERDLNESQTNTHSGFAYDERELEDLGFDVNEVLKPDFVVEQLLSLLFSADEILGICSAKNETVKANSDESQTHDLAELEEDPFALWPRSALACRIARVKPICV